MYVDRNRHDLRRNKSGRKEGARIGRMKIAYLDSLIQSSAAKRNLLRRMSKEEFMTKMLEKQNE